MSKSTTTKILKCIKKNKHYQVIGYKGKQVRDNIHAKDLVNCFWNFGHAHAHEGAVLAQEAIRLPRVRQQRPARVRVEPPWPQQPRAAGGVARGDAMEDGLRAAGGARAPQRGDARAGRGGACVGSPGGGGTPAPPPW